MTKKFFSFLRVNLLTLSLSFIAFVVQAGVCGCTFTEGGIGYSVTWWSHTDCKTPSAGLAIVENTSEPDNAPYYISIADAIDLCSHY